RQPDRRRSSLRPRDDAHLGAFAQRVDEGAGKLGQGRALMPATTFRVLITVALIALMELVCRVGLVSPHSLIPPTEMAARLGQLLQQAQFWQAVGLTAQNIVMAMLA